MTSTPTSDSIAPGAATVGAGASVPRALPIEGLESAYDALATAIDTAGTTKTEMFLVKLALLNANALGDAQLFRHHMDAALKDL